MIRLHVPSSYLRDLACYRLFNRPPASGSSISILAVVCSLLLWNPNLAVSYLSQNLGHCRTLARSTRLPTPGFIHLPMSISVYILNFLFNFSLYLDYTVNFSLYDDEYALNSKRVSFYFHLEQFEVKIAIIIICQDVERDAGLDG